MDDDRILLCMFICSYINSVSVFIARSELLRLGNCVSGVIHSSGWKWLLVSDFDIWM